MLIDHSSGYHGNYGVLPTIIATQYGPCDLFDIDLLIHLGEQSGDYYVLGRLSASRGTVWRVSEDGEIRDTFHRLTAVFEMSELQFFNAYDKLFAPTHSQYLNDFRSKAREIYARIPELPFSNVWMAKIAASRLPQGCVLHLGLSNTMRSWTFWELPPSVMSNANVGCRGIDGVLASAVGMSFCDENRLHFCVAGDLTFFYGMNVLGNRRIKSNLRLMLVNNGKGAEFKLYNHFAARFKDDAEPFIAGAGHFGNRSRALVRHYAEDLDFEYMSAENKDEYLRNLDRFLTPERLERPILFEVFTDSKDESDALFLIQHIESQRNALNFPKPRIFCGNRSRADQLCKALGIERKDFARLRSIEGGTRASRLERRSKLHVRTEVQSFDQIRHADRASDRSSVEAKKTSSIPIDRSSVSVSCVCRSSTTIGSAASNFSLD